MAVFSHHEYHDHEQVLFCRDGKAGLCAIIAVHNTHLGPSLGGCRMYPYPDDDAALEDVLRLSKGMTYKSAMAGLPLGGGKSVIIADPKADKTPALFHAMGRMVDSLGGRYIAAEDSGTTVADLRTMGEVTAFVAGVREKVTGDGTLRSGDPSPATAHGVFEGIKAAVKHRLQRDSLAGLKVAVQGLGSVGFRLAKLLAEAGATLWVADVDPQRVERAVAELQATSVAVDAIYGLDVDVFAPCALGAVINDTTLPALKASVVAGAANNQLARPHHDAELRRRGILYAPDYVINAGGIVDVYYERAGFDRAKLLAHLDKIHDTLVEIFQRADREYAPTQAIADRIAEERFGRIPGAA
ncbi:MAG: Glu/Leu/Phe/Val dehydrogenase dimerization domain-containing protein [Candidatus Competibacterales bacterium]